MSYRVPVRLGWVRAGFADDVPQLYLMPLPNGEPVLLQGSAATIWLAAVDGDLDEIWAAMDDRPTELEQARDFLNTLLTRGLLEFTEEDR